MRPMFAPRVTRACGGLKDARGPISPRPGVTIACRNREVRGTLTDAAFSRGRGGRVSSTARRTRDNLEPWRSMVKNTSATPRPRRNAATQALLQRFQSSPSVAIPGQMSGDPCD